MTHGIASGLSFSFPGCFCYCQLGEGLVHPPHLPEASGSSYMFGEELEAWVSVGRDSSRGAQVPTPQIAP